MHEIGQLAILAGPQHQVPMVWHQTIGEQAHSMHMFLRFGDNVQEGFVVKVLVKNWQPSIASVEDMIEIAAQRCSPRPAHAVDNNQPAESSQEKKGPDTFSLNVSQASMEKGIHKEIESLMHNVPRPQAPGSQDRPGQDPRGKREAQGIPPKGVHGAEDQSRPQDTEPVAANPAGDLQQQPTCQQLLVKVAEQVGAMPGPVRLPGHPAVACCRGPTETESGQSEGGATAV